MKKVYEKPAMYVENFSMTQSIATGCGAIHDSTLGSPTMATKETCGWDNGIFILWTSNPGNNCNHYLEEDTDYEGVCYNNPNGGTTIFNS